MKFDRSFFSKIALTGIQVLFFTLLFRHLGSIIDTVFLSAPKLSNIDAEKAVEIEEAIKTNLQTTNLKKSLYRYFVFFYLDEYTSRQYFISSNERAPRVVKQEISSDPFYPPMVSYHLNNLCYIINTTHINQESIVYESLSKSNEIAKTNFYVSCPIFIDDVLVGYIGGFNNKDDGSISIETTAVRNAAANVSNILSRN